MTSVAIVSGAVGRIKYLMKQTTQPCNNEVGKLLQGLEAIKKELTAAYDQKTEEAAELVQLANEIVRLSYEIVDAIADVLSKPKEKMPTMVRLGLDNRRSRNMELGVLELNLYNLRRKLINELQMEEEKKQNPASLLADSPASPAAGDHGDGDLLQRLRDELLKQTSESLVVCIEGSSGMGKSTLARKVFYDDQLRRSFDVFAWVPIHQDLETKRVLQALLQQLGPQAQQERADVNEIELIGQIFAALEKKKYLLVLDDIAAVDDWQSIRVALPTANSSRVIITTTSHQVAQVAARTQSAIFKIPPLTQSEILRILMEGGGAAFNQESIVKAISIISGGSPLLVTILGKSLESEVGSSTSEQQLVNELVTYKHQKGTPQVLGACYKRLAPELKPCFLYLAQFPQGHDVDVEKLHLLLAAEDLIPPEEESQTFLKSIRGVLGELARKKLVEVPIKGDVVSTTCTLHDQVREFCKLKGSYEELFEIVELGSSTKVGAHTRRLAIYLSNYRDDKSNPCSCSHDTVKQIRSLLIFDTLESEPKSRWPSEINDLKEFTRLRVLNFDRVDFRARKGPKGIGKLVFLRYLSFRGCWLEELPSSVSKLTHLETLDLLVHADSQMFIPNSTLTNKKRLLHLYLPRRYESDAKSKLQLQGLEMLQVLVNLDTEACDVGALSHLNKLKILTTITKGHHKDLEGVIDFLDEQKERLQHSRVDIRNLDRYNRDSVSVFKKLLRCQFVHSMHIKGQIGELTEEVAGVPKVAEIVLDGSELEHDPMDYLGKFRNLQSLILRNDAFVGSEIVISAAASNFPSLRSLKLQKLQYLEKLTVEQGALRELSTLQIHGCPCLLEKSIPKELLDRLAKGQGNDGGA